MKDEFIPTPIGNAFTTGTYDGADLQKPPARAGALDAFDKPSLVSGQRVKRCPPAIIPVRPVEAVWKGIV